MGVSPSAPLWAEQNLPSDHDMWGYKPPGLATAPQYNVSEIYTEGRPPTGHGINTDTPLWVGQFNDRLESFGNVQWVANEAAQNQIRHGADQTLLTPSFYAMDLKGWSDWTPDPTKDCNPLTYPNCDLSNMRSAAPLIYQYENTWGSTQPLQTCADLPPNTRTIGCNMYQHGIIPDNYKTVTPMDPWLASIDANVASYKSGAFDALSEVNKDDTSSYDPCDNPTLLNAIFPPAFALAGAAVVRYLFQDSLDDLGVATSTAVYAGVIGTMYAMGQVAAESTPIFGDADERKEKLAQASAIISTTTGIVAGLLIYANSDADESLQYVFPIVGGVAGLQLLQQTFLGVLTSAATGFYIALLPNIVFQGISKLWCKLTTGGMTACNDYNKHPSARRWDVASIAARMTDMACEGEGWERTSPQAEFVFRSLVTNPFFMDAANVTPGTNTLYDARGVNPAGQIAPLHETGYTQPEGNSDLPGGTQYSQYWNPPDMWSFTGNTSEQIGYTGTTADHNFFACQNFDIMWNADECTADGNVGNNNGQLNCAEKYHPAGSDTILAQNLKGWLKSAIAASYNPANIANQSKIKGLQSDGYTPPKFIIAPALYLQTCFNDYDNKTGTGFDSIKDRANYASLYKASEMSRSQYLLVQADQFLNYASLQAAWAAVNKFYDSRNVTAWAHYVNKRRGITQEDSFKAWSGGFKAVEEWAVTHVNEGFGDTPLTNLTPFLTPIGAPVNDNPILQPIGAPISLQPILDPIGAPVNSEQTLYEIYSTVVDLIQDGPNNIAQINAIAQQTGFPDSFPYTQLYGNQGANYQYLGSLVFAFLWARQPQLNLLSTGIVLDAIEDFAQKYSHDTAVQDDVLYGAANLIQYQKWFLEQCTAQSVARINAWNSYEK